MRYYKILCFACVLALLVTCTIKKVDSSTNNSGKSSLRSQKLDALYDNDVLGEIHLTFTDASWDALVANTKSGDKTLYSSCDFTFSKADKSYSMSNVGVKNRGNTSFRPPVQDNGDYQQAHFKLKFTKYHDDSAHHLEKAAKAMNLKYMLSDSSYVQEVYCYDLFKRFGVWEAPRCAYTKLYIKVGDKAEAYFGMYKSIENIDKQYLKARVGEGRFASDDGNLWKCLYQSGGRADLSDASSSKFGVDESHYTPVYSLKTNEDTGLSAATAQFKDFITKLNSKTGSEFENWIKSAFDVDGFLRALAVDVACGMWDDIWRNYNNYYIYFDTTGDDAVAHFIPYDYDNTLGVCNGDLMQNPAEQDPLKWGNDDSVLCHKILSVDTFKAKYKSYLKDLIDSSKDYFDTMHSIERINSWYTLIEPFCDKSAYNADYHASKDGRSDWSLNKGMPSDKYNFLTANNNYFIIRTHAFQKALGIEQTDITVESPKYTVTFDPNGGTFSGTHSGTTSINIENVETGTTVSSLNVTVSLDGSEFQGWYNGGNQVDIITGDITLTAKWLDKEELQKVLCYVVDTANDSITFTFDPKMFGLESDAINSDLYIRGSFNSWNISDDYSVDASSDGNYYLSLSLSEKSIKSKDEYKFYIKGGDKWLGAENIVSDYNVPSEYKGDKGNFIITF